MFNIEPQMRYTIFDMETSTFFKYGYAPISKIESGYTVKKIHMKECWYDEYRLCLKEAFSVTGLYGEYVLFRLKDYGIKDYRGIAFTIDRGNSNLRKAEIYQVVSYDDSDCIHLCIPANLYIISKEVELHLLAACYEEGNEVDYLYSKPQCITRSIKKGFSIIDKQRQLYTDFSSDNATLKRNCCKKLPYKESFLPDAWRAYPDAVDFLGELSVKCDCLDALINELPDSIEKIDTSAPDMGKDLLFVPLECTYNQKFFARLYMAREHSVLGRIISSFDMIQYQIPISATNEPLLLFLYGSHWIEPVEILDWCESIGDDKCADIHAKAANCSTILSMIDKIQAHQLMSTRIPIIRKSSVGMRYSALIKKLSDWIEQRTKEAICYSENMRPSLWKSEYRMYQYIRLLCPDAIYQYHSEWLGRQSLDVYIPKYKCAIEYQGRQHYDPINYFGGTVGLTELKENDCEKIKKCKRKGVKLLEWTYKDKLSFSNVLNYLNKNVFPVPVDSRYVENYLAQGIPFPISDLFLPATFMQLKVGEKKKSKKSEPIQEIRKYRLDGEYICSYSSVADAAKDESISMQQIYNALNGRSSSSGGFMWKRTDITAPVCNILPIEKPITKNEVDNAPKSIYKVSLTGEILSEFDSIKSAERKTGINRKNIRDALNGRLKTAGGYCWALKDTKKSEEENTSKAIYQLDQTGKVLKKFDSIRSAERKTGINRTSIRDAISGRQKTAGGYYWTRKDDET